MLPRRKPKLRNSRGRLRKWRRSALVSVLFSSSPWKLCLVWMSRMWICPTVPPLLQSHVRGKRCDACEYWIEADTARRLDSKGWGFVLKSQWDAGFSFDFNRNDGLQVTYVIVAFQPISSVLSCFQHWLKNSLILFGMATVNVVMLKSEWRPCLRHYFPKVGFTFAQKRISETVSISLAFFTRRLAVTFALSSKSRSSIPYQYQASAFKFCEAFVANDDPREG